MLSIIVCSVDPGRLKKLTESIEQTTGNDYELLVYVNGDGKGLCEIYNEFAARAKNEYLCFVHEDVLFHTTRWDEKIIQHLKNKDTGVIGVMGGRYKSAFGLGWSDGRTGMHRFNFKNGAHGGTHLFYNPADENKSEVVCLDGAFLCCTKQTWINCPFDENTLTGFHFYDMDFCMQSHASGLKNYVIYDVLIEHFSEGNRDEGFLKDSFLFADKWKEQLPSFLGTLSRNEISNLEGYALTETIQLMKKYKLPKKKIRKMIQTYFSRYKNFYQIIRLLYFGLIT